MEPGETVSREQPGSSWMYGSFLTVILSLVAFSGILDLCILHNGNIRDLNWLIKPKLSLIKLTPFP